MCQKLSCRTILAKCIIIILTLCLGGLFLIHLRLSDTGYIPEVGDSYRILYEALTAVYILLYTLMFIWVLLRYCVSKRVCGYSNFLFMLASVGYIALGGHLC
jgi:hypothetical protein